MTRRQVLRSAGALALLAPWTLDHLLAAGDQQGGTVEALTARRATLAAEPIVATKLTDTLTLLSGPGGNVLVLAGADGKVVIDSFVQPVWPQLKKVIDGLGSSPLSLLIDTHWHFDHTDNNANFHQAGATILAHVNTRARLSQTHDLLGMHFVPSPSAALPTRTFRNSYTLQASGESLELTAIAPAHTDSDIAVRFISANVLHMGDVFFNRMYPFIDASTGGNINGMIAGASLHLTKVDDRTRIVPGHGPIGDRKALTAYRDMLVTVRDRVQKLKADGRRVEEAIAAKPTASFDAVWGKGILTPDDFVGIVYGTLGA